MDRPNNDPAHNHTYCMSEQQLGNPEFNQVPTPHPVSPNRIRPIGIEEVNRGYIVRIACHTFAISAKAELIIKLTEYIDNPEETEKKWFAGKLFSQ